MNFFIGLIAFLICLNNLFALPVVHTEQGLVEGIQHAEILEFRGIPYGEAGRWEETREPSKHRGILRAYKHGAISMQAGFSIKGGLTGGKVKGAENSQFINIAVSKNRTTKKMPVLLWIHGGAHVMGDGSQSGFYNISRLAREGKMIVASINYRLGSLGYFAHPD
ncbi:MAG: carboxylesterase family protein, partial [Bdellovibrionales bacterium]|nr:carboxylesterase family protein [Bdellovibrionales bacterium]